MAGDQNGAGLFARSLDHFVTEEADPAELWAA